MEGKLGLSWCRAALGTYSQRTLKDVHTAVHTSLAARAATEGEQAGERRRRVRDTLRGAAWLVPETRCSVRMAWKCCQGMGGLEGMEVET